jgi:hypothetical protein
MPTPAHGATRVLRAVALGSAALGLAVAAHAGTGGGVPSGWVLGLVGAPMTLVALLVTARRCRPGVLLAVLGMAQLALHTAFTTLAPGGPSLAGWLPVMPLGEHGAHSSAMQMSLDAAAGGPAHGAGGVMTVAHVLATLATAWLLARGEGALWRVARRLFPRCPTTARLASAAAQQGPVQGRARRAVQVWVLAGGRGLRGPPAGTAVTA